MSIERISFTNEAWWYSLSKDRGLTRMITLENVGGTSAATIRKTLPILEKNNSFYSQDRFPTSETLGRTGTSLWRSNCWRSNFWVFLVDKR